MQCVAGQKPKDVSAQHRGKLIAVAVCDSVLQYVAAHSSVLQRGAGCCSVLQYVAGYQPKDVST